MPWGRAMLRGLPGTKLPAQCTLTGCSLLPCQGSGRLCGAALSAALTLCRYKIFSFEVELGLQMERTDSSIFQKFIVPD